MSYFIFGPLVFTEASEEYVRGMASYVEKGTGGSIRMLYTGIPAFTRYGDDPSFDGERIVIVPSPMFSHKIGTGLHQPLHPGRLRGQRSPHSQPQASRRALRDASGRFVEFTFSDGSPTRSSSTVKRPWLPPRRS